MSDNLIHRSFTAELEVRKGGDGRTIYGIAVPYNHRQRIDHSLTEQFVTGAFDNQLTKPERVKFKREHRDLIGKAVELRDDAAGLVTALRVSKTPLGDETLELARDGALTDLSVGFREGTHRRLSDGTIERTSVDLREISIVENGAYGEGAMVSGVRSAEEAACVHCGVRKANAERAAQILAALPVLPSL